uniref:Uncharacterized protein n=1 Tax=Lepeophtheirus salmonis TaxID=72036 RepID=A0A0K2UXP6_LEPSM
MHTFLFARTPNESKEEPMYKLNKYFKYKRTQIEVMNVRLRDRNPTYSGIFTEQSEGKGNSYFE